jgi:hypothetical protein
MNARVDHLLHEALELPDDERSALVAALLDSLEGSADPSISEAWREEVRKRPVIPPRYQLRLIAQL